VFDDLIYFKDGHLLYVNFCYCYKFFRCLEKLYKFVSKHISNGTFPGSRRKENPKAVIT